MSDVDENSPLFAIAVAAELAGMHPQTLRQYDRLGLVSPTRTAGKSRRYSMRDVVQLREVARLSSEGVSLEGIARILRVKGRGVESSKGKGDLLAVVQVAVPSHLSPAQREALEAFHAVEPAENPRTELLAKARE